MGGRPDALPDRHSRGARSGLGGLRHRARQRLSEEAYAAAEATDRFRAQAAAEGLDLASRPYSHPQRPAPPPAALEESPDVRDLTYRGRPRHAAGLDFEHSAYALLIDKHGVQRLGIPFERLDVDALAQDLRVLRDEP